MHLEKLLYAESMRRVREEAFERAVGESMFHEIRNGYLRHLAAYIRLYHDAQRAIREKIAAPGVLARMNWQPHGWCEAAYHIVAFGDPDLQADFLMADQDAKDRIVGAVLMDKGVTGFDGIFREIGPC